MWKDDWVKATRALTGSYVRKLVTIAVLSVVVAYFLPDLTAGAIRQDIADIPGGFSPKDGLNIFSHAALMAWIIASCFAVSLYGVFGLVKYTLMQKHQGRRKLGFVLLTYFYMAFGFANTYFMACYVGDAVDAIRKYHYYHQVALRPETREAVLAKELRIPDRTALKGVEARLWSAPDSREQLPLLYPGESLLQEVGVITLPDIYKVVSRPQSEVIRYLPENKLKVYGDCLYFSTITIATVGYGDISPQAGFLKFLVCMEVIVGQLLLALGISSAFSGITESASGHGERRDKENHPQGESSKKS